ncbi:hypothetical protein Bpfe_005293, partial [Biomphalaria pfeifferi]
MARRHIGFKKATRSLTLSKTKPKTDSDSDCQPETDVDSSDDEVWELIDSSDDENIPANSTLNSTQPNV